MTFAAFDLLIAFAGGAVVMWMIKQLGEFIKDWRSKDDNHTE